MIVWHCGGRLPQEPVLQNQNAWEAFKTAAPADAAADGGGGGDDGAAPGDGPADDDNLWNEFQSREEQQKKRARSPPPARAKAIRQWSAGAHARGAGRLAARVEHTESGRARA